MIFAGADTTGFEEDARLTAMWLWTISPRISEGEEVRPDGTEDADVEPDERPATSGKLGGFALSTMRPAKLPKALVRTWNCW